MKKILKADRGFTIVELLVVIVVIGILAAITMVSYNGVTSKANKASSQQAANNLSAKAEIYYADGPTSNYPATLATLTGAASSTTYFISGVSYAAMGSVTTAVYAVGGGTPNPATPSAPAANSGVLYVICGIRVAGQNAAPANLTELNAGTITGYKVYYWDYTTSLITTTPITGGNTSVNVGTQAVGCVPAGS